MALTSDDVNFLVYRYLQESGILHRPRPILLYLPSTSVKDQHTSTLVQARPTCIINCPTCGAGFSHSSFVFGYEAFVHRTNIGANQVPPGALVSFLQRGIQYVEMQSNLNEVCF